MVSYGPQSPSTVPRPTGTVTFLFTDIEGSTPWEKYPEATKLAPARYTAAWRQGDIQKARTRFFACADEIRETLRNHRPAVERASVEKDLAIIRSKMDDGMFAGLSGEGRTMTTEQAIALALET
jgi:hypothetical protein